MGQPTCHHPERVRWHDQGGGWPDAVCDRVDPDRPDAAPCHLQAGHETTNHHSPARSGPCFTWQETADVD